MLTRRFSSDSLYREGFPVFPISDHQKYDNLCCDVRRVFSEAGVIDSVDRQNHCLFFEQLHFASPFDATDINDIRVRLISALASENLKINAQIFQLVESEVTSILGPDLLIQRGVNLVVQRPNDPDPSEPHRDFPANSAFEIVIWLPLSDCPIERTMYAVSFEESLCIAQRLRAGYYTKLEMFNSDVIRRSLPIPVAFGEVLIFLTPIFHGSLINSSNRSRVSFNTRVKSFFSPSGSKDPFLFWDLLNVSPVTKRGLQALRNEL